MEFLNQVNILPHPITFKGSSSKFWVVSSQPRKSYDTIMDPLYTRGLQRLCMNPGAAGQLGKEAKRVLNKSSELSPDVVQGFRKWVTALTRACDNWLGNHASPPGTSIDHYTRACLLTHGRAGPPRLAAVQANNKRLRADMSALRATISVLEADLERGQEYERRLAELETCGASGEEIERQMHALREEFGKDQSYNVVGNKEWGTESGIRAAANLRLRLKRVREIDEFLSDDHYFYAPKISVQDMDAFKKGDTGPIKDSVIASFCLFPTTSPKSLETVSVFHEILGEQLPIQPELLPLLSSSQVLSLLSDWQDCFAFQHL